MHELWYETNAVFLKSAIDTTNNESKGRVQKKSGNFPTEGGEPSDLGSFSHFFFFIFIDGVEIQKRAITTKKKKEKIKKKKKKKIITI